MITYKTIHIYLKNQKDVINERNNIIKKINNKSR